MKLRIRIDVPEEEDLTDPPAYLAGALGKLEGVLGVLEAEWPLLCRCQKLENLEAEVSVSFLGMEEMRELNRQHRGVDEPTDVLAFPLWEESEGFAPFGRGPLPLGDVVICPEEAEREHAPMPPPEALCLVLAHGFLHLLGWDHDTPEREEAMWERQESLKSKLLNAIEGSSST